MKTDTETIVIMNQKGGVGKTTTADMTARDLAQKNKRVLLIDFDPQMTLTVQFGIKPNEIRNTPHDSSIVFSNQIPQPKKVFTDVKQEHSLDMLFASPSLTEYAQSGISARELKLKAFLKKVKHENKYDYIVIDTAGSLGVLFTNAALCADTVILPIATSSAATQATEPFFKELIKIEDEFDHSISNIAVFGNMYNSVPLHDREQLEEINSNIPLYIKHQQELGFFSDLNLHILKQIPNRSAIKDAMGTGIYLRDYIRTYANTKSNKEILETCNQIFKLITGEEFETEAE